MLALTIIRAVWNGPDTFIQIIRHNDRLKVSSMPTIDMVATGRNGL